jgi:hypothetical protein
MEISTLDLAPDLNNRLSLFLQAVNHELEISMLDSALNLNNLLSLFLQVVNNELEISTRTQSLTRIILSHTPAGNESRA